MVRQFWEENTQTDTQTHPRHKHTFLSAIREKQMKVLWISISPQTKKQISQKNDKNIG